MSDISDLDSLLGEFDSNEPMPLRLLEEEPQETVEDIFGEKSDESIVYETESPKSLKSEHRRIPYGLKLGVCGGLIYVMGLVTGYHLEDGTEQYLAQSNTLVEIEKKLSLLEKGQGVLKENQENVRALIGQNTSRENLGLRLTLEGKFETDHIMSVGSAITPVEDGVVMWKGTFHRGGAQYKSIIIKHKNAYSLYGPLNSTPNPGTKVIAHSTKLGYLTKAFGNHELPAHLHFRMSVNHSDLVK